MPYKSKISSAKKIKAVEQYLNGELGATKILGIVEAEMYYLFRFDSYDSLKIAIERYIHFYNNARFQARLGGLAPLEYRAMLLIAA